jgi:DNA-binding MarR family transcriptional regulator
MNRGPFKFHSLLHSAELIEKRLAILLSPIGIKPRQARILNVLSRVGEVSQTVLTEKFDVTSGSMSTMVDRMIKVGLIERRKNPEDRRGDLISITDQGTAVLEEVRDVWRKIDELIEAKLGAEKTMLLTEITKELKFALGGRIAHHDIQNKNQIPTKEEETP